MSVAIEVLGVPESVGVEPRAIVVLVDWITVAVTFPEATTQSPYH
jgi:hypothetical protein